MHFFPVCNNLRFVCNLRIRADFSLSPVCSPPNYIRRRGKSIDISVNGPGFLKGTSHTMFGHVRENIKRTYCLARFDLLVHVDRAVPEGRVTETA